MIICLGAERQAATSIALSRPDLEFLFCSEEPVIDGWDLPNVRIQNLSCSRRAIATLPDCREIVALDGRWLGALGAETSATSLASNLEVLVQELPGYVLPVTGAPPLDRPWIAKGDRMHLPDQVISGQGEGSSLVKDPFQVGILYQRKEPSVRTILVGGFRVGEKHQVVGMLEVLSETFCREDVLAAARSIDHPELLERSKSVLDTLNHLGFFSMNWIETEVGDLLMTSFRPTPRAYFQIFRRGEIDLLNERSRTRSRVLPAGLLMVAEHHYAAYGASA